jgi:hypothetical protein
MPLALAGEYADVFHNPLSDREKQQSTSEVIAERLLFNTVNMLASRTGLETMGQISDMLHGLATDAPTALRQYGAGLIGNIAGSYVPMSGLLHGIERATDPTLRQPPPGDIGAALASRLPGFAETVQPRLDVLGRPMQNPQQGLASLVPTRLAPGEPSPILDALQRTGVGISAPPQKVNYGPFDEILQQSAQAMTADPKFQASPLESQRYAMKMVDQLATRAADLQVLSTINPTDAQTRAMARPGSLTAPVQGYGPGDQPLLMQQLQRDAQHRALINSLLGG